MLAITSRSSRTIRQSAALKAVRQVVLSTTKTTRTLSVFAPTLCNNSYSNTTRSVAATMKKPLLSSTTVAPVSTDKRYFSSSPPPPPPPKPPSQPPGGGGGAGMQLPLWMTGQQARPGEYLDLYTTNLTQMAADGKLDPIIGRHDEIRRCLQILARRTKNST